MKREILFRGNRTDGKGWIEGLPIYLTEYAKDFDDIDGIQCNKTRENYDVEPETVGQFTGLTDKNGTKIFEGDFFDDDEPGLILVVVWCEKLCQFTVDIRNKSVPKIDVGIDGFKNVANLYDLIDHNEVIGNIHGNGRG